MGRSRTGRRRPNGSPSEAKGDPAYETHPWGGESVRAMPWRLRHSKPRPAGSLRRDEQTSPAAPIVASSRRLRHVKPGAAPRGAGDGIQEGVFRLLAAEMGRGDRDGDASRRDGLGHMCFPRSRPILSPSGPYVIGLAHARLDLRPPASNRMHITPTVTIAKDVLSIGIAKKPTPTGPHSVVASSRRAGWQGRAVATGFSGHPRRDLDPRSRSERGNE